eukprot:739357-Pleurochrysis_carterae.AAC.1
MKQLSSEGESKRDRAKKARTNAKQGARAIVRVRVKGRASARVEARIVRKQQSASCKVGAQVDINPCTDESESGRYEQNLKV